MKLSLFSQIVKNGEDSDLVFNGGEMRNKLFDVRIEGTLKLTSDYKDCLCLLSQNPLGCMIYLIKPLFSRMGDYRALVVAVPRQVVFAAAADLPAIVREVSRVVTKGEDTAVLAKWFEKDYEERDFDWKLPAATKRYAYRLYGPGSKVKTLDALLGTAMLQDYYGEYEGVYLLNAGSAGIIRPEAMDNLSEKRIAQPAIVYPPMKSSIPNSCQLMMGGDEFLRPVLASVGSSLRLRLAREGYVPNDFSFKVAQPMCTVVIPGQMEWLFKVYEQVFRVLDEEERPVAAGTTLLEVAGIVGSNKKEKFYTIREDMARNAQITVNSEGYVPQKLTANLMNYSKDRPLVIKLERARKKVKYKIGRKISFDLARTDDELLSSPLPDYEVGERKGDVITLHRKGSHRKAAGKKGSQGRSQLLDTEDDEFDVRDSGFRVSKWSLYKIGSGLIAGLLIGGLAGWFFGSSHGENNVREEIRLAQQMQERIAKERADSLLHVQMVGYLDSIPKWKKEEMDSVFEGKMGGLYDALNTYNFVLVQEKGAALGLDDSRQWTLLDSAINVMNSKKEYTEKLKEITKNEDELKNKFFSPDGSITIETFLKKLEEAKTATDKEVK